MRNKKLSHIHHYFVFIILALVNQPCFAIAKTNIDPLVFDDTPIPGQAQLPKWFDLSFLNLNDSLNDAIKEGKKGIILYFGREDCAYCKALLNNNWGDPSIVKFTQTHFNVIAIDVNGDRVVTDFNNKQWEEKAFATHLKTNFTPTLLFYNKNKQLTLKLPGYRPKYQFRAALEFVADAHYKHESFRQYLTKAESSFNFGSDKLNDNELFMSPPYRLYLIKKPLVVLFEYPNCHACDVLHGNSLNKTDVINKLKQLNVIQLDSSIDTPVITPDGKKTTSKKWANTLNLTFAPSLIFFDENGKEIIRIESVLHFNRLSNVLSYVINKEYKNYDTFQNWVQSILIQRTIDRK